MTAPVPTTTRQPLRIGIAGAGLLGRLLAFALARAGHRAEVHDPAAGPEARGAAGWTAAGMLSPLAELESADERVFRWGLRSIELWPQILAALPATVEFRCDGSLLVAHREDAGAARRVLDVLANKAARRSTRGPDRPARRGSGDQQVQRYEATKYKGVSVERLQAVADALKLRVRE